MKNVFVAIVIIFWAVNLFGQVTGEKFGKGFQIMGKDSTYFMKIGIRTQSLFSNEWTVTNDDLGNIGKHESSFMIRRARLKFNGFAYSPKLTYKIELGLSNRDISGSNTPEFNNSPKYILDAYVQWNFYKNFSILAGQTKLPGNRERVISSANLQFVDRSRLNSRYNLDRDMGLHLKHHFTIFNNFLIKEIVAFSQGEGRNVTAGNIGGYDYTFRVEALPFGKFQSKGDYIGAAIKRESKPKLSIGITYDMNVDAGRERGQNGSFIKDSVGNYVGKTLNTLFVDLMFKYKQFSLMGEYANKTTLDGDANVYSGTNIIGTYFTGTGLNVQAGWMFSNNWEVGMRYTDITPEINVSSIEKDYSLAVSKYFVGHKLKIQTDLTYRQKMVHNNTSGNGGKNDNIYWRTQVDIHF